MGEHGKGIDKAERDGKWRKGESPRGIRRRAEAIHTQFGHQAKAPAIAPLPEPEGLE